MGLEEVLERSRPEIEAGIAETEAELKRLREHEAELEALIGRGRAALGTFESSEAIRDDLTLHGAMEVVLLENGNRPMSAKDLAAEVNERGLYRMKDGRPAEPGQIQARVHNYPQLFEREDALIRLKYRFTTSPASSAGAYWAALTTVTANDGSSMAVITRLSYSAAPREGQSPEQHVAQLSQQRARRLVNARDFVAGGQVAELLTTGGWRPVDAH